jgi:hypothetical protein
VLTIFGKAHSNGGFCDGVSRRDFLTIGGSLLGGAMTLPNLLAAERASGTRLPHKAVINVFLPGGPPHQDMWDLKPDAPTEIRGEFNPIKTNIPGIEIGEHFPQMAKMMDRFVVIRSISECAGDHDAFQCMTGRKKKPTENGYWPSLGAWASKVLGPANKSVPPHLSLMYRTGEPRWGYPGDGGFLGMGHAPFRLVGGKATGLKGDSMALKGLTLEGLAERGRLLKAFDSLDRTVDKTGSMDGMDAFTQQAMGILTSSKLVDALDLSKENPKVAARYGVDDPAFERDGAPRMVRNFCIARRLVEAGARVVTMNFNDLHDRGLDKDVSVVVWGEFGRTPRINKNAGRDHWPQVSCALLAGGGMKTGQVIGATNRLGEYAVKRPVTHQEVFATLFTNLGVNLRSVREFDPNNRPQYPVEPGTEPIREVI